MTGPNAAAMASNMTEMKDSTGATNTAMETMASTTEFQAGKAINLMKTTLGEIGNEVMPMLSTFITETLIPALNEFTGWLTETCRRLKPGLLIRGRPFSVCIRLCGRGHNYF